jgi:hypothetical protein
MKHSLLKGDGPNPLVCNYKFYTVRFELITLSYIYQGSLGVIQVIRDTAGEGGMEYETVSPNVTK